MTYVRWTVAVITLTAVLGSAAAALAGLEQKGNLQVTVSGEISPKRLPRSGAAPIAVTVAGGITTLDGSLPPQLKSLRIELNRHGQLDTRGLPKCRIEQIQPASTARALSACRSALVGKGSFSIAVVLGTQDPYPTKGRLLIFNGTYKRKPALLGQIYSPHPFANSFVIPFRVSKSRRGHYGAALTARLPRAFTAWGYVTGLEMRIARRFTYRGRERSVLTAACPAPEGFPGALFTFARTSFTFAGGVKVALTSTNECSVTPLPQAQELHESRTSEMTGPT